MLFIGIVICNTQYYNFIEVIKSNPQLNLECIDINPNVASTQRYPLFFESFKEIFSKDIEKMHLCTNVIKKDRKKLFDYMTSKEILDFFENQDKNSLKKYDFTFLYELSSYYLNPIVDNKFIIEEMARQDKVLFAYISEDIANNNQFMFKLFHEHKAVVDKENPVEALYPKIRHFGNLKKYLNMLKLEHSLSSKFTDKSSHTNKKVKI